eukprot:9115068-Alexandrium_andersonii.AAC.1
MEKLLGNVIAKPRTRHGRTGWGGARLQADIAEHGVETSKHVGWQEASLQAKHRTREHRERA